MILSLSATETLALGGNPLDETVIAKPPSYAISRPDPKPLDLIGPDGSGIADIQPDRHILISLADQLMWVFEGDEIVQRFPVSTGVPGHRTPTGNYSVHNQSVRAFSNRYECWMLHWMAITSDGLYGMHALQGTSYLSRLGNVASHGCIRLSHENAEWLYNWVDIGTPVEIVDDWEEPPAPKAIIYRMERRYCL